MRVDLERAMAQEELRASQQPAPMRIVANSLPGTVRNLAHLCVTLEAALRLADEHLAELADAWERGALSEHDGLGGTRSNRNFDVRKAIRAALSTPSGTPGRDKP